MNHLREIVRCRLCLKVALAALLSIFAVEAAILIPSFQGQKKELLARVEHVGYAFVSSVFRPRGHTSPRDLVIYGETLVRSSQLRGGAFYDDDGRFVGAFGEVPEMTPETFGRAARKGRSWPAAIDTRFFGPPPTRDFR